MARSIFWDDRSQEQYNCDDCGRGIDEIHGKFEVHHKDGNPYNNDPENLVGLCKACHAIREDRKPAAASIEKILNQFQSENTETAGSDQPLMKFVREIVDTFGSSDILWRKLGYDGWQDAKDITPKNRREAALFQLGREKYNHRLYMDNIRHAEERVTQNSKCEACGSTEHPVKILPSKQYGSIDDRMGFCVLCTERLFDMISEPIYDKKVASRMEEFASRDLSNPVLSDCEVCKGGRSENLTYSYDDDSEIAICRDCKNKPEDVWWKEMR